MKRRLEAITPEAAEAWEAELMAAGQLLPSRQGRRPDAEDDAFAESFEDFLLRHNNALVAELGSQYNAGGAGYAQDREKPPATKPKTARKKKGAS